MHIIIGLLGSLVTIFCLLDRLGIDIGDLTAEQAESMLEMMGRVAAAEGQPSESQQHFIDAVRSQLSVRQEPVGTWA